MSTISDEAAPSLAAEELITLDEVASAGRTALYRLYDSAEDLLYIGISDDPIERMKQHAREQPWWPQVARKTAVWYQHRDQAERAETIAIGLEQPRHNKAKRYVRLPEQSFPELGIPPVRRPPRPTPKGTRSPDPSAARVPEDPPVSRHPVRQLARYHPAEHVAWDPGFPPEWPADLWCISWYYMRSSQQDDPYGYEDFMRCNNGGLWPLKPLDYLRERAEARREGWDGCFSWWQPSADGLWFTGLAPAGPGAAPDEKIDWEQQRRFLFALLRAGRCASIQVGPRAWVAGIRHEQEARVIRSVLAGFAYGPEDGSIATACLEARYREPALQRNGWRWLGDRQSASDI